MSTDLVRISDASRMLAEAETLPDIKMVANLAQRAQDYAKAAKLGLDAQNHAAAIRIEAEAKAGDVLAEMKESGQRATSSGQTRLESPASTLGDLGVTRNESSNYQRVASVEPEVRAEYVGVATSRGEEVTRAGLLKYEKKKAGWAEHERRQAAAAERTATLDIVHGDALTVMRDMDAASFDAIITDPPYPREFLHLYGELAEGAAHVLKDGGICAAMAGQSYLPDVLSQMLPHLDYHWTVAYLTPGGQAVQLWDRKVNTFWKPVLVFVKGVYEGEWFGDVSRSDVNDNDKRFHGWGQSESGMADLVERLTRLGDRVLDPFAGGGTTGVVCQRLDRDFVGIELGEPNDSA